MGVPLFSCLVPVKGPRPYLDEALASLSAQGMGDDLEVIVQDGDREHDAGQSDALNRGFAKARGQWLFWLNADDLLLPGALQNVKSRIENWKGGMANGLEWIAGNQVLIDEKGDVLKCSVGNGWHDWLYRHAVPHVHGPSSFFRRELLDRAGGFDASLHICMDWDMWIRFMKAGARFERIDGYLWAQRQWDGSKTQRKMGATERADQERELVRMLAKNGFKITRGGVWTARAWRILNGSYFREWRDGRRMRGRKAGECAG